jgi:Tfp pilus assembly protein PilZ
VSAAQWDVGGVNLVITVERRKHTRGDIRWPIAVLADHGTIKGETRNISVDGISIRCDEPLMINEVFRIAILPPDRQAIGVSGKVVWSDLYAIDPNDTAVGLGVCFVKISDEDRKVFKDAVSAFVSKNKTLGQNRPGFIVQ